MTFLNHALSEYMTLAAPPGTISAFGPGIVPEPHFDLDDEALALCAIDAGLDDAERTGTRAAVCVVTLTSFEHLLDASPADIDAADAWLLRRLRPQDRLYRVGGSFVVVTSGLQHPHEAELLAERLGKLPPARGETPAVGMALYPTHGADAVSLLERARASEHRARQQRRLADDLVLELRGTR